MDKTTTGLVDDQSRRIESTADKNMIGDVDESIGETTTVSPTDGAVFRVGDIKVKEAFADAFDKMKQLLGFGPICLNGGHKTLKGTCYCPQYYNGTLCENIICLNYGVAQQQLKSGRLVVSCKCPHPDYIKGAHCELVSCRNGGRDIGTGQCQCIDQWYSGQFCQHYTTSWSAVLGLPLLFIVLVIVCCVICRLDLCPRRRPRPSSTNRRTASGNNRRRVVRSSTSRLQLPNNDIDNPALLRLSLTDAQHQHYTIRLDTLPTFNPSLLTQQNNEMVNEFKPIDPPPTYEQVIAASGGGAAQRSITGDNSIRPPSYFNLPSSSVVDETTQIDSESTSDNMQTPNANQNHSTS